SCFLYPLSTNRVTDCPFFSRLDRREHLFGILPDRYSRIPYKECAVMRQGHRSFQRDNPASPADLPDGQFELKSQPGVRERVRQIEAEQVRLLYTQAFAGCIATVLNAGIVTVVLWKVVARPLLLGWLTLLLVVVVSLFVLLRLYQ